MNPRSTSPPASSPVTSPVSTARAKPRFNLGSLPPTAATPSTERADPFAFPQDAKISPGTPQPVHSPFGGVSQSAYAPNTASNPWQDLFASSGAPTPSVHALESPFHHLNAVSPNGQLRGGIGGERRGSLGGTAVPFSKMTIESRGKSSNAGGGMASPQLHQQPQLPAMAPSLPSGAVVPRTAASPEFKLPMSIPGRASSSSSAASSMNLKLPPAMSKSGSSTVSPLAGNGSVPAGPVGGTGRRINPKSAAPPSKVQLVSPSSITSPVPANFLILDLRTHALFSQSRVPTAIPITIPSTLLRRPNFTLDKLLPMLASDSDRARVQSFREGLEVVSTVLCYDQDGSSAQDGGTLTGLLAKFEREGFKGELGMIKGGFMQLSREGSKELIDMSPLKEQRATTKTVNGRELPIAAFQQGSTAASGLPSSSLLHHPFGNPTTSHNSSAKTPATQTQAANPFFDNIRQNAELSQGITERIPLDLPSSVVDRCQDLPPWLRELVSVPGKEAAETLAMQFYRVELGEQRRLQGIMNHHSRNPGDAVNSGSDSGGRTERGEPMELSSDSDGTRTGKTPSARGGGESGGDYFPYSITAGLEKGSKNRFKNIWPFDHARVRLNEPSHDDGSDYVNASHIQPRGTHKRYIATQGPLPSTYQDFWTLCWEQNVRVIVMLTKQHEGGQVKCGDYWSDKTYGPLTLEPLGTEGGEDVVPTNDSGGFYFGAPPTANAAASRPTIKRSFVLSNADEPTAPKRHVTQLQYVSWPDFDIPEAPTDLLDLIHDANELQDAAAIESRQDKDREPGPLVVHCSAGVGRTGSYVIVDAILDAAKRELRSRRSEPSSKRSLDRRVKEEAALPKPPSKRRELQQPSFFDQQTITSPGPTAQDTPSLPSLTSSTDPEPRFLKHNPQAMRYRSNDGASFNSFSSSSTEDSMDLDDAPPPRSPSSPRTTPSQQQNTSSASFFPPNSRTQPPSILPHASNSHASFNFKSLDLSASSSRRPSLTDDAATISSGGFPSRPGSPNPNRLASENPSQTSSEAYVPPRKQRRGNETNGPLSPLGDLKEPVKDVLEDMRQQRMSLCQTLRQYVFAYRVIVYGILKMVDEDRERQGSIDSHDSVAQKRQASPTELSGNLTKRPSIKLPKGVSRHERSKSNLANNITSSGSNPPAPPPLPTSSSGSSASSESIAPIAAGSKTPSSGSSPKRDGVLRPSSVASGGAAGSSPLKGGRDGAKGGAGGGRSGAGGGGFFGEAANPSGSK